MASSAVVFLQLTMLRVLFEDLTFIAAPPSPVALAFDQLQHFKEWTLCTHHEILPFRRPLSAERPALSPNTANRLILNELRRIVCQIQTLLCRHDADAPLLHGQSAEKHFDGLAIFVLADVIDDIGVGVHRVPIHAGF